MKALQFKAAGEAAVVEVPDPVPASGEVLVEVAATGLCHTDFDILHGRYLAAYPVVPGHEIAGTVVATGDGVRGIRPGDRVAVDPLLPCARCAACLAERPGLCRALGAYGGTRDGGFAPLMAVKATNIHPIGALPFATAALAEPLACVLHGIDRARPATGSRALVFGAGPIGLMMAMGLQARHGLSVTVVDIEPSRRERARAFGIDEALDGRDAGALARAGRFGLVADCTGVARVCEAMPCHADDGGTLLFFGVCPPEARAALSPYEIFRRELTLVGSHSLSGNLPDAIATLEALGERAAALVSHRMDLDGIAAQLRSPVKGGTMKVQYDAAA